MPVWIFQDAPGVDMSAELRKHGIGALWTWNIDRYYRAGSARSIAKGDFVLQWQPDLDEVAPAGIYAQGITLCDPYYEKDSEGDWHVQVRITDVYSPPLPRHRLVHHPKLSSLQILRMPQHRVFEVTDDEFYALQGELADLSE